jgi:hypothetical protein
MSQPFVYCAFIQVSDPASLTDTSDKKMRRGAIGGTAVLDMPIIFLSSHCGKLESCLSEAMDTNYR